MTNQNDFSALRKGLLELVVLKVIAARKSYAAEILAKLSGTEFATQEGTLYPLLSKLRRDGAVDYEWVESEQGPPRKYYFLTAKGKDRSDELDTYWNTLHKTINNLSKKS
ncbi:MAG TPA: PadR family transcriptional regulator [Candidatus Paceibacterota bacterium]|nr:PadR family transcriptional regulator [Candidatus Paceibacterota bacterium]